jgi:transposase
MNARAKNKYIIRSRISEKKFREIVILFCFDTNPKETAEKTGISRVTVNKLFDSIRQRIYEDNESRAPKIEGDWTLYFYKNGTVYLRSESICSIKEIKKKIAECRYLFEKIYDNYYRFLRYARNHNMSGTQKEYKQRYSSLCKRQDFWEWCKEILLPRSNGVHKDKFSLHLKECEFRYNNREKDPKEMYHYLLKIIRENPLKFS